MKKLLTIITLLFLWYLPIFSYFDGGINYITGKDGYEGKDIYLLIGKNDFWIKPSYSAYKQDNMKRVDNFSIRTGFEKISYTASFNGSYTTNNDNYKAYRAGGDITFSLKPTSSHKRRIAGPNSSFVSRNTQGVTQIDFGGGANLISHNYSSGNDITEINTFLFAGAKIFITQISVNYSFSTYNKSVFSLYPANQKLNDMNSYFPYFIKNSFNLRLEFPHTPFVTPYASYNKVNTKNTKTYNIYSFGAYIDLAMVGANIQFETYKDKNYGDKRKNFLSVSAGIRF